MQPRNHLTGKVVELEKKQEMSSAVIPVSGYGAQPTRVTGYGVPNNSPRNRQPVKPEDLPQEVTEWLNQISVQERRSRKS